MMHPRRSSKIMNHLFFGLYSLLFLFFSKYSLTGYGSRNSVNGSAFPR